MQTLMNFLNNIQGPAKLLVIAALGAVAIFFGAKPAFRTMKHFGDGKWGDAGKDIVLTVLVFIVPLIFISLMTFANGLGNDVAGLLK